MLKALDLTKISIFESPRDPDKGKPEATRFRIGAIPSRVYAILKDKATKFSSDPENPDNVRAEFTPNLIAYDMVRFALRGVENYNVDFGTQKENIGGKSYEVASHEFMASLELETIRELQEAVKQLCEFDAEEVKN